MKNQKNTIMPEYMNGQQVMKYLGIQSYETLYSFVDARLPYIQISDTIKRFKKSDIDEFMKLHTVVYGEKHQFTVRGE